MISTVTSNVNNVIILGANGMLGRYMYKYFSKKIGDHKIICITRNVFDFDCDSESASLFLYKLVNKNDLVINCMGMTNKRDCSTPTKERSFYRINSVLPKILSLIVYPKQAYLVHITTDCVFTGELKPTEYYDVDSTHNALDLYGITKSLGDASIANAENVTVIRCSIIGETLTSPFGNKQGAHLVEWLMTLKPGSIVNGFTNHHWNGVTCLELAKFIYKDYNSLRKKPSISRITGEFIFARKVQNAVSKYDLIKLLIDLYELDLKVVPVLDKRTIVRVLQPTYDLDLVDLSIAIQKMKEFDVLLKYCTPYTFYDDCNALEDGETRHSSFDKEYPFQPKK